MDEWDQLLALANLEEATAQSGRWVTVAEAAEAASVSRSALRAWYRNGEIPSTVVDGPHGPTRMLPIEAVMERARRSPRAKRRAGDEVAALRARVDDLERRLAALEAATKRRP